MYGPPGTGKTLLARAVAHHTDCTFIRVSGSELVQKYIGEGSRMVSHREGGGIAGGGGGSEGREGVGGESQAVLKEGVWGEAGEVSGCERM